MKFYYNEKEFSKDSDIYRKYIDAQRKRNQEKYTVEFRSWVKDDQLEIIAKLIIEYSEAKKGICHGVAFGYEIEYLKANIPALDIIGTDIAKDSSNVINWDFHDVKPEWINNIDFIYSNALDHSYSPWFCLDQWMSCVKKNGVCILHHHITGHNTKIVNKHDCFSASLTEYKSNISKKYNCFVHDSINVNNKFLIIKHL